MFKFIPIFKGLKKIDFYKYRLVCLTASNRDSKLSRMKIDQKN